MDAGAIVDNADNCNLQTFIRFSDTVGYPMADANILTLLGGGVCRVDKYMSHKARRVLRCRK